MKTWPQNAKRRLVFFLGLAVILSAAAACIVLFCLPKPIVDVGLINGDQTDFERYAAHFPNQDPREFPEYYAGTYHELSGEMVFVIRPNHEYMDPVDEIRELTGNPNVRIDYAIYTEEFLNGARSVIGGYAGTHPDADDPFRIVGVGSRGNRILVISCEKWTRQKIQQFKEHFGIYSQCVVFASISPAVESQPIP